MKIKKWFLQYFYQVKLHLDANPRIKQIFPLLAILLALRLTVLAALTVQNLRQHASGSENLRIVDANGNLSPATITDPNIYLQITLPSADWKLPSQGRNAGNPTRNFSSIVQKVYAQAACHTQTKMCNQDSYNNCTLHCDNGSAYYTCVQGKPGDSDYNPNCQGTIYCNSDNSLCPQPTTPQQQATPVPTAATRLCTPNAFDSVTCSRCTADGAHPGVPGTDFGTDPAGSPLWCSCAKQYNQSYYQQYCQQGATQPTQPLSSPIPTTSNAGTGTGTPQITLPPTVPPNANTHILQGLYIENKDTDGSSGGHEAFHTTTNLLDYLSKPVYWKLNDLKADQTQAQRVVQVTLFDGVNYVPFTTTITLTRATGNVGIGTSNPTSNLSPSPTQGIIHISSCQEITKPGNYVLDGDVINKENKVGICFTIHDVSNITLDCNNHLIYSSGNYISNLIKINNTSNFTIKSCHMEFYSSSTRGMIDIYNSNNGTLSSNTIDNYSTSVYGSTDIHFVNNSINDANYNQRQTNNSIVDGNKFTVTKSSQKNKTVDASIYSSLGSYNKITNNVMDGGSDGVLKLKNNVGADDGILIGSEDKPDITIGENGDTIQNNSISNVYDCGIETLGLVQNTNISNNKIDNTGTCGIGGWYSSSWFSNVVSNNITSNSPSSLVFYYVVRSFGYPADPILFKSNTFKNNKLIGQKTDKNLIFSSPFPIFIDLAKNNPYFNHSNNIFIGNDTGNKYFPYFDPVNAIIDGGENTCINASYPDFPLKCIGAQPSGTVYRIQSINDLTNQVNSTKQAIEKATQNSDVQQSTSSSPISKSPPCYGKYGNNTFGYGDIDGDGVLTQTDYDLLRTTYNGSSSLTPEQEARAYLDGQTVLTSADVGLLGEFLGGKRTTFPVCSKTVGN